MYACDTRSKKVVDNSNAVLYVLLIRAVNKKGEVRPITSIQETRIQHARHEKGDKKSRAHTQKTITDPKVTT